MVSIPIAQNQVGVSHTPMGYFRTNASPDAFGASIAQANINLSESSSYYVRSMAQLDQQIKRTKALELSNKIDQWEKDNLLDPENGYYSKLGKDAMGKSGEYLENLNKYISDEATKEGLTWGYGKQMAELVKARKIDTIYRSVTSHELKQTQNWGLTTLDEAENYAITKGITNRNSPDVINTALANGKVTIAQKADLLNWDEDTTRINVTKFTSDFHSGVLNAYLQDGSLKASEYYEQHKNELLPDAQARYLGGVKSNELKYKARTNAENLLYLSPEEAYKRIDEIDNIDEQMATRQMYGVKLQEQDRIKEMHQNEAENTSWQKVQQSLDINDIDLTARPETIKAQMSYIEQMKKFGRIATDYSVYMELQDMSTYDATRFKTLNLSNYAASLSEDEFKTFKERQRKIGSMEYTIIQDDNKLIDNVLKDIGLHGGNVFNKGKEESAYSQVRSLVKEWETRHGTQINDSQLQDIVKSLGYKDPKTQTSTYKEIEKGMAEKAGFIKAITNDMAYFEKVHKRPPSQEERFKMIYGRANGLIQDKNRQTIENISNAVNYTQPKNGETKELTFYADRYLPQLGKEVGVKLTVVNGGRYREPNGKYHSYHSEGKACDISMSEHTLANKLKIVQSELDNPLVKAIGTSDPHILRAFKGNSKIVNESAFDAKQGTDHTSHIHVTLNTKGSQNVQTVRMQTPSGRIVLVPQNMVSQAIKNGGKRI